MARKYTISCKGKLIDLSIPKVMGIVNITPDSFFDGGKNNSVDDALAQVQKHLDHGAAFIDVGGYSTRPDASLVSVEEENLRVIPVIKQIVTSFPDACISIDTFNSKVALQAVEAGACIINDISGGDFDSNMFTTLKQVQVPYVLMHSKGSLNKMHQNPQYANVTQEVILKLSAKLEELSYLGINDIIVDPGFGFAKNLDHNFELLKKLEQLQILNKPILAGISRKSMIFKTLESNAENALNGTTVLNTIALQKGAAILRVHDSKEASEAITLTTKVYH